MPTLAQRVRDVFSLSRPQARSALRAAGYDGASGGRRLRNAGEIPLPIAAQLAARQPLAWRARYLTANNGFARAGVLAWQAQIAGTGIKPQSAAPDPAARKAIATAWERFVDGCDADGMVDFYGLLATLVAVTVTDGEAFAIQLHDPAGRLKLRLIDATQIDGAYHADLAAGARIVAGVEFNAAGERVAYHAYRERPGLPLVGGLDLMRLPAQDVLHVFRPETPGQVRGVSWFAPVLARFFDLDKAHDAQLMRQQIAAMLAGFIVDPQGEAGGFEGPNDGLGTLEGGLEPGTIKLLRPGADIRFSETRDDRRGVDRLSQDHRARNRRRPWPALRATDRRPFGRQLFLDPRRPGRLPPPRRGDPA